MANKKVSRVHVHLSNGLLQNNKNKKDTPGVNNGISGYYEIW